MNNGNVDSALLPEDNKLQDRLEGHDSRSHKFAEGVEMLSPVLFGLETYIDERGRKQVAFEIHGGRMVRRNKHGKAVISNVITYVALAVDPRFQDGLPHLESYPFPEMAQTRCQEAIDDEEGRRNKSVGG